MLVCSSVDLILEGYTNSDFQSDKDSRKLTSRYVFTLGRGVVSWRSIKQSYIVDSTTKVEYVVALEVAKRKFCGSENSCNTLKWYPVQLIP